MTIRFRARISSLQTIIFPCNTSRHSVTSNNNYKNKHHTDNYLYTNIVIAQGIPQLEQATCIDKYLYTIIVIALGIQQQVMTIRFRTRINTIQTIIADHVTCGQLDADNVSHECALIAHFCVQ